MGLLPIWQHFCPPLSLGSYFGDVGLNSLSSMRNLRSLWEICEFLNVTVTQTHYPVLSEDLERWLFKTKLISLHYIQEPIVNNFCRFNET